MREILERKRLIKVNKKIKAKRFMIIRRRKKFFTK